MGFVVLDLVLLGVIALFVFMGYKNGLMISLFNLGASAVAIILAYIIYPIFADFLKILPVYGWIRQPIYNSINEAGINGADGIFEKLNLPGGVSNSILDQINKDGMQNDIGEISDAITDFIIKILAIIVLFILIKICFIFIKKFVKKITDIPVIHQLDKVGGIVIGIIEAFIILTMAGALFNLFSGQINSDIMNLVEDSVVARFFYHNNFITGFLAG